MLFRYGLKQFSRRPFASILLLFLFAMIILLIDFTLIKLDGYFRGSELIKGLGKEDCYKVSTDDTYLEIRADLQDKAWKRIYKSEDELYDTDYDSMVENGEITQEEVDKLFQEHASVRKKLSEEYEKEEEKIYEKYPDPDYAKLPYVEHYYSSDMGILFNDNEQMVYPLSEDFTKALNFRMKKGVWLGKADTGSGYIPLAVAPESGYELGDTIMLYANEENTGKAAKGKVVGIIDTDYYTDVYSHGSGREDEYVDISSLISLPDEYSMYAIYTKEAADVCGKEAADVYGVEISEKTDPTMVKLKDNITDAERKEFFKAAADERIGLYSVGTVYENTYNKEMKKYRNDIVYISLSFLMAVIVLIGISAINTSREIKNYSIYCIHGMTRRQCIGINVVYISTLIVGSTFIALCVKAGIALHEYREATADIPDWVTSSESYFDYFNISTLEAASIPILLIIAIIASMIIPFTTLRKLNILSTLKEN